MKKMVVLFSIIIFGLSACKDKASEITVDKEIYSGKVIETIDVASYTYVKTELDKSEIWVAGPPAPLKKGDVVYFKNPMMMADFTSKTLNKTFEVIYFVDKLVLNENDLMPKMASSGMGASGMGSLAAHSQNMMGSGSKKMSSGQLKDIKIEKVDGAYTIAELFENKADLSEKKVTFSAKVTKFSANIMKKNWIHLQDGTAFGNDFDLTATTQQTFSVGDIVTLEGVLKIDQDFGYGYFYSLIIEDVSVK